MGMHRQFFSARSNRILKQFLLMTGIAIGFVSNASAADLPNCADGQTLVYSDGEPACGPACPAHVYGTYGVQGSAAYNIPASNVGDVHPPAGDVGLPSGDVRNGIACSFHLQCSAAGWVAITTGADSCRTAIWDVP